VNLAGCNLFCDDWAELKFTLKYRGRLKSAQGGGTKGLVHTIRRTFDSQLKYRWQVTPELKRWMLPPFSNHLAIRDKSIRTEWYRKRVGNYLFLPLVIISDTRPLVAELDVRILWRDRAGNFLAKTDDGIDLDNRLKVILDALTVPQENQLPTVNPQNGEEQTFCLLADDKLVVKLGIAAERLIGDSEPGEPRDFADVSIEVVVRRGDGYEVPFGDF
jgi:hypothetical protein